MDGWMDEWTVCPMAINVISSDRGIIQCNGFLGRVIQYRELYTKNTQADSFIVP